MARATTDDPAHDAVVADFTTLLEEFGYHSVSIAYHDTLPEDAVELLQTNFSPSALCMRLGADFIAIPKTDGSCFFWDAKSNSKQHPNMSVEALQLDFHVRASVPCFYAYRDSKGPEGGFWTTSVPKIDRICIQEVWSTRAQHFYEWHFRHTWPDTPIVRTGHNSGSGDPFVIILAETLKAELLNWRTAIGAFAAADTGHWNRGATDG